ncbi:MAG TPA: hypothetical protein DGG94_13000 [Micromonosporaceae bacterium]|nr:hypothetical protein [Micromonosporaceae bacterium]
MLLSLVAGAMVGLPSAAVAGPGDGVSDVSVPMAARAKVVPKAHAAPPVQRPPVAWPSAASATVDLPAAAARSTQTAASTVVGGLPIAVSAAATSGVADVMTSHGPIVDPSATTGSVSRVALSVLDRQTATRLGVGVVLTASRADGQAGSAPVSFDIDYAKFAFGYGADYGRRLRLVQLPSCALTTPDRRECADQQPVTNGRNDTTASKVSGTVDLAVPATPPVMVSATGGQGGGAAAPEPLVLAITSSSSSDSGDFTASTLNQSSSWAAGSNSGDFTTTVPLTVAPAPGGLVPSVALNYSSGSVDGLTKSTNTQAPWTGEGWTLSDVSFVERSYRSCKDDGVAYTGGDLCWVSSLPVSIVLNGHATQIMDNSGNGLKAEDDSLGWKVERLTGASGNGARDGEYFKVTTMDGTQYFFGYRDRAAYGGVQRVEVFGNNPGEPCYIGGNFNANHCPQAYRWNLDYVVDRFGNTMVYNWGVYEGNYGMNRNTTAVTYDITSTLASIEYGANVNVAGSTPTGKVTFAQGFRCFYGDCAHTTDPSVWMDTPWDQRCDTWATSCPGLYSPTFWTLYRLDEIMSSVWDAGIGGWTTVDYIRPSYGFPPTGDFISPSGDDTSPSLWAWKIWLHNRPPIDISGIRLANRVFWGNDLNRAPMNHYRIEWLKSGTGQTTTVTYTGTECTRTNVYDGASDHNPRRCFPQYEDDQYRWYHKYVATDVTVTDTVGGSPTQRWHYDYSTAAAQPVGDEWSAALWHYDSNWLIPANRRAFSQWRGYTNVTTIHGNADGTGPQQVTENIFYRGMNGDRTTAGGFGTRNVTFSDGWDHSIVDHEAMQGKLRRSMTFDGRTGVWTSAVRHLPTITQTGGMYMGGGTPDLKAWRALETSTITQTVMAGPTYRLTQTDTTYDSAYPIPTLVHNHGDLDAGIGTSDDRCTATSYVTPDLTKHLINFPKQTLTTTCAPVPAAADHLAGNQYFYDGSSTLGSLGTGANAKGNLTKTLGLKKATTVPLPAGDWIQQNRSTSDVYGRTLDSFDGLDRKTTTVYTPATGGPTTSQAVTTPPPNGTGAGFTTTTDVDIRWGTPVAITDPNGKITRAEYDPSGRLTKVWKNHRAPTGTGGVTPDIEYAYVLRDNGPNYVSTKTLIHTGAQIESFAVLDGLLRPRRAETVAATGTGRMIVDTFYDTVGNIDKKLTFFNTLTANPNLDAYSEPTVPSRQQFVYDNLGRVLRDQLLAGDGTTIRESIYTYDGDKTSTMQPPAGGTATTTINDVRGQAVELRQHVGGTPAGAVDVTTKYTRDRLGQLTKVVDNANNQWLYEYDLLGRSTKTTDPDTGVSTSTYDDAGQLTETVDGNGTKLVHKYDGLGRKTELRETSATGFVRASWTYDPVGAKGHLASTSRHEDASTTYTSTVNEYDAAYRVKETTHSIPGFAADNGTLSYTVKNSYTVDGLMATQELPAANGLNAEILTHNYSPVGKATTMVNSSGQTYVNNTEYQFDGLIQRQFLGNAGKQVRLTNDFDPATRRLSKMWTSTESQTQPGSFYVPYDNTYSYDKVGNVTSVAGRVHGVADQQECFTYDHLRRMTEAWTQTSGTCATPQRTGADPYRRQWPTAGGYDKLGSRLKQIDKDTTDTTWNYTIGGVDSCGGASKPHAVTSITATGPKAGTPTRSFCYDAAGNTTRRTTDTGAVQDLAWDKERHLRTVTQGTNVWTNIYDVDGTRLIAKTPTGDTLYLPDGTEIKKLISGQLEAIRYYSHNGKTIALRNGTTLTWIAADHHDTQQVQIAATSLSYQRRRSMPFGETRGTQPTFIGTKGYVGGTIDDTGLTHIGAREYDPTIGRFVSIDPEIDHLDPQTLHGYLYSNNNPATYSDPTGRSWASIGKGLKDGWFKVNTAPIQFMDTISKTQLGHVDAVVSGNESVGEALENYTDFAVDVAADVVLSPITTAAEMFTEGENAIDAANNGDWEGAAEHGYIAAADAAYTATFVLAVGSRFGRGCHSFAPATPVLMAGGTTKAIKDVAVGDQVLATDPLTGVTESKPVTDLHLNEDWDLADVTVLNDQTGEVSIIQTTWTHAFWNATDREWTDAAELTPGDRLRDPADTQNLVVTDVDLRIDSARMRDLTVGDFHTYYVIGGETPVLVHNCNRGGLDFTDAEKKIVYDENLLANNGILLCHYCKRQVFRRPSQNGVAGRPDDAQVDHVQPKSRGGHGGAHNGVVACRVCNRNKSTDTVQQWDDRLRGFLE